MSSVFVIINEWDDRNGSGSEIVECEFYPTVNSAWEALVIIAESHDSEIGPNDTTFVVRADEDAFESYYIQELNPA